jgi:hypothetical protein
VKLIQTTKTRLVFQLGQREEDLLLLILKQYPCVPSAHHLLSKSGGLPDAEANQRLLEEALAEQRAENKKQVQALLSDPRRFKHTDKGARLSLTVVEAEWLLQVLNDVRVGCWVKAGSPEEQPPKIKPATVPYLLAMEMAGYFQMQLLEALEGKRDA